MTSRLDFLVVARHRSAVAISVGLLGSVSFPLRLPSTEIASSLGLLAKTGGG